MAAQEYYNSFAQPAQQASSYPPPQCQPFPPAPPQNQPPPAVQYPQTTSKPEYAQEYHQQAPSQHSAPYYPPPPPQQPTYTQQTPQARPRYPTSDDEQLRPVRSRSEPARSHHHHHHHHHRSHSRPRSRSVQKNDHSSRNTFLGAFGGGAIGDAIFPGLGTLGGAVLGGFVGNESRGPRSSRPHDTYDEEYEEGKRRRGEI